MQLPTFIVDATGGATNVEAASRLTTLHQKKSGRVSFVMINEGTATVYVATPEDVLAGVTPATLVEAGSSATAGPYEWPDAQPTFQALIGGKLRVTPIWEE